MTSSARSRNPNRWGSPNQPPNNDDTNDLPTTTTTPRFQPMGCSTLKADQGERIRSKSEDLDHNFDLLPAGERTPMSSMESPMRQRSYHHDFATTTPPQSTPNQYLRQYQEKYGRMGLFHNNDSLSQRKGVCFPFGKEKRTPVTRSTAALGLDQLSRSAPGSARVSWDPYSGSSSSSRESPYYSADPTRSVGRSSGRDWHCQVYNNNLFPGKSEESLDKLRSDSRLDETKPSVVLAQTALRALNTAYTRTKPDLDLATDSRVVSPQSKLSVGRKPLSLTDLTGVDTSHRGDHLPEKRDDNPIPVINISEDYDAEYYAPKRVPTRSRASSRRAVSDLGFRSNQPAIVPTPRTAALLSNPSFRRHLAKNMGVSEDDLNETDFKFDFKLSLPNSPEQVKCNQPEVDVSPSKHAALSLRERILRTSISESSLNQTSAFNRSTGALFSNENLFESEGRPLSGSTDSLFNQSEPPDSFASPSCSLNVGFTAQESISAPNSPASRDGSPHLAKSKFHIPSFREFRENRTKRGLRHSSATPENSRFDLLHEGPIQEEVEGEERESRAFERPPNSPLTIARALNFDLGVAQSQGQLEEEDQVTSEECVVIYDPNDDESVFPDQEKHSPEPDVEPQHLERGDRHRNSVRRSKRSHKSRSKFRGQFLSADDAEFTRQDVHQQQDIQDANVQDNRGKHRKEPCRRSHSETRAGQGHDKVKGHHHHHHHHRSPPHYHSVDDNLFDSNSQVKVIKEIKLRDSMKGDSSDSKLMVVMVTDDNKRDSPPKVKDSPPKVKDSPPKVKDSPPKVKDSPPKVKDSPPKVKDSPPKVKDKRPERPPRPPEFRRKKLESKSDETYVIESQPMVMVDKFECVDDDRHKLDSKSRSRRITSRMKKERRGVGVGGEEDVLEPPPEFDDTVISGHPGDGFAMKPKTTEIRRSSRRSSRRRFLPKSHAVEESVDKEEVKPESEDDKPSDLPVLPTNQNLDVQSDVTVTRSVSDISDKKSEEQRKRGVRERRQKLYKSDPFQTVNQPVGGGSEEQVNQYHVMYRSVKPRSSREDILNFLQDAKMMTSGGSTSTSAHSLDSYDDASLEDGPSGVEVERVDSGVGAELKDSSGSKEFKAGPICEDCEEELRSDWPRSSPEGSIDDMADTEFLCKKCEARRVERKETIQEIADTEVSYGKDLKIIKEEFYQPMKTAGLLSEEQLETVFSNLDELITINDRFTDALLDTLELANDQGDEDYTTVHIGRLFLEASNMLLAFETYCVNQASVPTLLEKLEEEKELLRIFLQVSQTENSLLRRMNLRSFLMVPVQRVMKYPLLLNRLYKVTPTQHEDREAIKRAQNRVEDILEHINSQSRGGNNATMRIRRKISGLSVIKKTGSADDIEINKMAIELLGWNRKDVNFVMSGKIHFTQPTDHLWMKRGRTLKFIPAYALLLTLGRSTGERWTNRLLFSRPSGIQDAALVLIKEKAGKFVPLREPLRLERCVVSVDPDFDEVFEIMDSNKESFLFKGEDRKDTQTWLQHLKLQTKDLGAWRRRRNALPNIMIQTTKT